MDLYFKLGLICFFFVARNDLILLAYKFNDFAFLHFLSYTKRVESNSSSHFSASEEKLFLVTNNLAFVLIGH